MTYYTVLVGVTNHKKAFLVKASNEDEAIRKVEAKTGTSIGNEYYSTKLSFYAIKLDDGEVEHEKQFAHVLEE